MFLMTQWRGKGQEKVKWLTELKEDEIKNKLKKGPGNRSNCKATNHMTCQPCGGHEFEH